MARECRKMCGDMGLPSKLGLMDTAWAAARRTMCVAPKRVRRSLCTPDEDLASAHDGPTPRSLNKAVSDRTRS